MIIPLQRKMANAQLEKALTTQFWRNLERPLTIALETERFSQLRADGFETESLIQKELSLWRRALGTRKLHLVQVGYKSHLLAPYELTGLIHHLAKEFDSNPPNYRAVLAPEDTKPSIFALLKGLGFNCCQFLIEHAEHASIESLRPCFESVENYRFPQIGVQIQHSTGVDNLSSLIKNLYKEFAPNYIFVGTNTEKLNESMTLQQQTLFEHDLQTTNSDFLCLGPAAQSEFNGVSLTTLANPERYAIALKNGELPLTIKSHALTANSSQPRPF